MNFFFFFGGGGKGAGGVRRGSQTSAVSNKSAVQTYFSPHYRFAIFNKIENTRLATTRLRAPGKRGGARGVRFRTGMTPPATFRRSASASAPINLRGAPRRLGLSITTRLLDHVECADLARRRSLRTHVSSAPLAMCV